jgi:hypothetical protein
MGNLLAYLFRQPARQGTKLRAFSLPKEYINAPQRSVTHLLSAASRFRQISHSFGFLQSGRMTASMTTIFYQQ